MSDSEYEYYEPQERENNVNQELNEQVELNYTQEEQKKRGRPKKNTDTAKTQKNKPSGQKNGDVFNKIRSDRQAIREDEGEQTEEEIVIHTRGRKKGSGKQEVNKKESKKESHEPKHKSNTEILELKKQLEELNQKLAKKPRAPRKPREPKAPKQKEPVKEEQKQESRPTYQKQQPQPIQQNTFRGIPQKLQSKPEPEEYWRKFINI